MQPEHAGQGEDRRFFYHQDRNWNVVALTEYDDGVGTDARVVERYAYTPYGEFIVLSGDSGSGELGGVRPTSLVGNPFFHQGLCFDPEKGSYQNRHREYEPQRFMQRDPFVVERVVGTQLKRSAVRRCLGGLCGSLGDVVAARLGQTTAYRDGVNLYAYVGCRPTRQGDPSGLFVQCTGTYDHCVHWDNGTCVHVFQLKSGTCSCSDGTCTCPPLWSMHVPSGEDGCAAHHGEIVCNSSGSGANCWYCSNAPVTHGCPP